MTDPTSPEWAEHSACEQRITDDGQRIAELEADVTRLREALRSIVDYEVAQDHSAVDNSDCAACARCRESKWTPSQLCGDHYAEMAARRARNDAAKAWQHYDLRDIARAALEGEPHG